MDLTQTKISIKWKAPLNDGGCLVLGYKIYLDDGNNGAFTAKYSLTEPFTTAYDIDMTSDGIVGANYRVKMGVWNRIGEIQSDSVALVLASVPSTPNPPTYSSDGTYLDVIMSIPASNGGSPIISYQLKIRYNPVEDWITELGEFSENLQLVFRVRRNVS